MPNRSDSAGKLHQFYTSRHLKNIFPDSHYFSPLNNLDQHFVHSIQFTPIEIKSLEKIGRFSANIINDEINEPLVKIEDIGVSSGAIGFQNTDDIIVTSKSNERFAFSLKCAKNLSQILSKNMGARSLLLNYFKAPKEQKEFNENMDLAYLEFLNSILKTRLSSISLAKKYINDHAIENGLTKPRFSDSIYPLANTYRNNFLNTLRENLFINLSTISKGQIATASNFILDSGKNHIYASYERNKEKAIYYSISKKNESDILDIIKRGNDSVSIILKDYSVGFRFKFESGITSSIKLVGDYKKS
ncbi:hypothetical protein V8G69_01650 [Gaetbulibacter sp. M235]|uniref:hypothetical protein n=1 Tax=Gaetbulibacter sp. M235 TaxID=3126510 RepID=UPI00374E4C65